MEKNARATFGQEIFHLSWNAMFHYYVQDLSTSKSERNFYGEEMVSTQPNAHLGMAKSFRLSATAYSLGLYRTYRRSLYKTKT